MNARLYFARPPVLTHLVAALLSCALSGALLGAVTGLFQRDGAPFERVVAAERDCPGYAFVSEREACMRGEAASRLPAALRIVDGRGRVPDRRLKERLANSDEWLECNCTPIVRVDGAGRTQSN
jgi:hypothetical protein